MNIQNKFLTIEQVEDFISENKYLFNQDKWFLSRCIDGRYEKNEELEPLAKPGADIGDLMMILATSNEYALNIVPETALEVLINTVGGKENLRIHTDGHNCHDKDEKKQCLGCGHFKQASLDPAAYGLEDEDIDYIFEALQQLKKDGIKNDVLDGDHSEKAVIVLKSKKYSLMPRLKNSAGITECFIYHKTLDDKRRRELAKNLLPHVMSDKDIDEEYLYEVLTSTSDQQLFETVSRLAPEYPIYNVKIDDEGIVEVEE